MATRQVKVAALTNWAECSCSRLLASSIEPSMLSTEEWKVCYEEQVPMNGERNETEPNCAIVPAHKHIRCSTVQYLLLWHPPGLL